LQADYVTVVEDRPIMSVKYCLPVPVFYFWHKLTHSAARSLCDSWASCKDCIRNPHTMSYLSVSLWSLATNHCSSSSCNEL